MTFRRFYRYDFAATQVFVDLPTKYYGVAISAHIMSYTPISVVELLNKLNKPFFIDPMTFVFGRSLANISKDGKIKKSYSKLISDYGSVFSNCLSGSGLAASMFKNPDGKINDSSINDACKTVIAFQLSKGKIPSSFLKYEKLLKKGTLTKPISPEFLVAPYFFANDYGGDWYQISLRCAQLARAMKGEAKLYPVICIARDILWDETQISKIVNDYSGYDGYLIWISDLDEELCSADELKGLRALVSELATYGKPVYSLYGGYLYDLLCKFGLSGYSSGICYGEDRSVDAMGGGAGNRYYVLDSHLKISEDLANAFFAQSIKNIGHMCSCPTCSEIRRVLPSSLTPVQYADQFFTEMDFLDFRRHFVHVKFQESKALEALDRTDVLKSLDNDIQTLSNTDTFQGFPRQLRPIHLRVWRTLFT